MSGGMRPGTGGGNLAAAMEARAAEGGWRDRPAFLVGDRSFTHGEVHDGAARAATVLARAGASPGRRVLVCLPDGIELVWAFLGAVRLGAVAVLVNPRLTADDHAQMVAGSEPAVAVCGAMLADRFAADGTPLVMAEDLGGLAQQATPAPAAAVAPTSAAYAQFTSGTTGAPKGALHRHRDPFTYYDAFATGALCIRPDDVSLSVSKMFFAYGLGNSLFFPLLSGSTAVLHAAHPRPEDVAALVEHHRVSALYSVPTFWAHLVGTTRPEPFATVRAAVSAGEALTPALAERARQFLGCPILDGLGSTEVGQTFVSNTLADQRDGTVGRALPPYEVEVRDDGHRALPAGEVGSLWVRGPSVMLGYLDPAAVPAMDGDWLATGDRAVVDDEGYVHLRGRVDDIEIVGGINVAPLQVEEVLSRHPAVTEVAVAAVRDELGASRLEAFAVLRPGTPDPHSAGDELIALARAELAPFKVPRAVRVVDALPRTPTGKLRRFLLRHGSWGRDGVSSAPGPAAPPTSG